MVLVLINSRVVVSFSFGIVIGLRGVIRDLVILRE